MFYIHRCKQKDIEKIPITHITYFKDLMIFLDIINVLYFSYVSKFFSDDLTMNAEHGSEEARLVMSKGEIKNRSQISNAGDE